jgi:hypothetical protein
MPQISRSSARACRSPRSSGCPASSKVAACCLRVPAPLKFRAHWPKSIVAVGLACGPPYRLGN